MYELLLLRIAEPADDYYSILLEHKSTILTRIYKYGQKEVSKDLKMSQSKLSVIKVLLEAAQQPKSVFYYIGLADGRYKIGVAKDFKTRYQNLKQAYHSTTIISIKTWRFQYPEEVEQHFKHKYKNNLAPCTSIEYKNETFTHDILTTEDLLYIKRLAQ